MIDKKKLDGKQNKKPPEKEAFLSIERYGLSDFRYVEFKPVVEVVEVDGISGIAIGKTIGGKDALASFIVVVVTGDGIVEGSNGTSVKLGAGLLLDPCLELRISGL